MWFKVIYRFCWYLFRACNRAVPYMGRHSGLDPYLLDILQRSRCRRKRQNCTKTVGKRTFYSFRSQNLSFRNQLSLYPVRIQWLHPFNQLQSPKTFHQYHQTLRNNPYNLENQSLRATQLHHLSMWVAIRLQSLASKEGSMGALGNFQWGLPISRTVPFDWTSHYRVALSVITVGVCRISTSISDL